MSDRELEIPLPVTLDRDSVDTFRRVFRALKWLRDNGGAGGAPATATPLVDSGVGAVGTSVKYARENHVHPASGGTVLPATATPLIEAGAGAVGTATKYAREDHVHPLNATTGTNGIFGTKVDGNLTLSGNATMTSDRFYDSVDLAGFTLTTAGFRLFCFTLTLNGGTIANNGGGPVLGTGADPGNGAVAGSVGGGRGGYGGSGGGLSVATDTVTGFGGNGGRGGTAYGSIPNFSPGGTVSPATTKGLPYTVVQAVLGRYSDATVVVGGAGGGPGVGSTALEKSGNAGGGGGGVLVIAADTIVGTGTLQARGGTGGVPVSGSNAGSAGGGGGGVIFLISRSAIPGTVTTDVSGGAPGAFWFGNGVQGLAGSSGRVVQGVP